jgi:hypothetical protein
VPNLQITGRALVTVLAQGLASITNFAVGAFALAAADGDLGAFGRFALAFQVCQLVIAVGDGAIGGVVLIHTARQPESTTTHALRDGAAAAAMVLGAGLALPIVVAGVVIGDSLGLMLLMAAIGCPGLVLQYTLRASRFARVDPQGVVRADLVWFAVLLAAAVGDWLGAWDPTVPAYLAVWLVGASISALPMYRTAVLGGFRHLGMFWRVTGPQSVRIGIDSLLARSVFVVSLAAASIIIDDEASGLLAAAVLVFSPMSVIHASSLAVVIPAQVRMGGIHVTRYRVPIAVFAAISVITIVWAAALLVFNETRFAFGPFDLDANGISTALFFATLLRFLGLAFWRGPQVSLRVADAAVESLRARMVGTSAQWGLSTAGFAVAGLEGGALWLAIGTWIGALVAWQQYRSLRKAR